MQRVNRIVAAAAIGAGLWLMQDVLLGADRTRIFITFISHNEQSTSNASCQPVLTNPERFLQNRAATVSLANVIWDKRAALNFQSDWEYLLRLRDWETDAARATTSGLNLVQYLNILGPGRLQVDAHNHQLLPYNYADVSYLLEQFTVPPNGIVGGFVATPPNQENWTRLRAPQRGLTFRTAMWTPQILWGGGSAGHRTDLNLSGIWRPKSGDQFAVDDPSQVLVNIGTFPQTETRVDPAPVAELLTLLRNGRLEAGKMYTATIVINQCEIDSDPSVIPRVGLFIDQFREDVERGDLVWATLTEMVRVWREDYESTPLIADPAPGSR